MTSAFYRVLEVSQFLFQPRYFVSKLGYCLKHASRGGFCPGIQFLLKGNDLALWSSFRTMDGEADQFPSLNRAHVLTKVGGYLFPAAQDLHRHL